MKHRKAAQALCLIDMFTVLASLALVHENRLFGHDYAETVRATALETESGTTSGETVINTASLGKDVTGYGGPVPVNIYISAGRVDSVQVLPNAETPGFFRRVTDAGLPQSWNGLTVKEAALKQVDAVSGATYSSTALIANVRAGINKYISEHGENVSGGPRESIPVKLIVVSAVLLMGAVIPLFTRNPRYHLIQQLLNVGILGFWGGTFIDYAMMLNFMANGPSLTLASFITLALLFIGFIYPLFGKYTYYCTHLCPLGSLQDLAGHLSRKKLHIRPKTLKVLEIIRQSVWVVLMAGLWAGFFSLWLDNELFTGFIVESASWWVIAAGIAVVILSVFIPRPFCRFLCPTGVILHHSQNA